MNKEQAFQILVDATAQLRASRQEHELIVKAIQTLQDLLKDQKESN